MPTPRFAIGILAGLASVAAGCGAPRRTAVTVELKTPVLATLYRNDERMDNTRQGNVEVPLVWEGSVRQQRITVVADGYEPFVIRVKRGASSLTKIVELNRQ